MKTPPVQSKLKKVSNCIIDGKVTSIFIFNGMTPPPSDIIDYRFTDNLEEEEKCCEVLHLFEDYSFTAKSMIDYSKIDPFVKAQLRGE